MRCSYTVGDLTDRKNISRNDRKPNGFQNDNVNDVDL